MGLLQLSNTVEVLCGNSHLYIMSILTPRIDQNTSYPKIQWAELGTSLNMTCVLLAEERWALLYSSIQWKIVLVQARTETG